VIYYWYLIDHEFWLFTLYNKDEMMTLVLKREVFSGDCWRMNRSSGAESGGEDCGKTQFVRRDKAGIS